MVAMNEFGTDCFALFLLLKSYIALSSLIPQTVTLTYPPLPLTVLHWDQLLLTVSSLKEWDRGLTDTCLRRGLKAVGTEQWDQLLVTDRCSGTIFSNQKKEEMPKSPLTVGWGKKKLSCNLSKKKKINKLNKSRHLFKFALVLLSASVSPVCGTFFGTFK